MKRCFSALLFLGLLLASAAPAHAQFFSFGRNKVQYTAFDWQVLKTEHFDIYYYPAMKALAERGACFAEEAYTTLEDLDALFRYHRRLGLSPGEFKRIQHGWLEKIRPEGIEVEELAETVHPSRYVRGSDILDIFGQ